MDIAGIVAAAVIVAVLSLRLWSLKLGLLRLRLFELGLWLLKLWLWSMAWCCGYDCCDCGAMVGCGWAMVGGRVPFRVHPKRIRVPTASCLIPHATNTSCSSARRATAIPLCRVVHNRAWRATTALLKYTTGTPSLSSQQ